MRVRSIPVNKRESNEEVARIPLPKAGEFLPLIFVPWKKNACSVWRSVVFWGQSEGVTVLWQNRKSF